MAKHMYLIFTNASSGREAEFNDWYTNTHLQDVLRIPGIQSAQRFQLSDTQRTPPPHPWTYAAIYEIETDDLPGVLAELRRRAGTADLPLSDAMVPGPVGYFFEPITGVVTATNATAG